MGDCLMQYANIPASSLAVVQCSFCTVLPSASLSVSVASRPLGVMNQVSSQPSSAAFLFIRAAKAATAALLSSAVYSAVSFSRSCSGRCCLPMYSARATAVSLWDSSIRECSRSRTVYCSPFCMYSLTLGMLAA